MPFEDPTFIENLNQAWPLGTDPKSEGDDHLRGLKNAIKNSFPNTSGAWKTSDPFEAGPAVTDAQLATLGQVKSQILTDTYGMNFGYIDASGSIIGGTGDFTSNRVATGEYNLTFNQAASSTVNQAIVAIVASAPPFSPDYKCLGVAASPTLMGVTVVEGPTQERNSDFYFVRVYLR